MQTNDDQEESHLRKIWNLWAPEGFMDEKEWPRLSLYPWAQQLKFSAKIVTEMKLNKGLCTKVR